ncbi:MAG TPA: DUF2752 domain-containing protein [Bacillota bacterium]|nr:DUF2752 domain-containing protein [Bacillota bacterium]
MTGARPVLTLLDPARLWLQPTRRVYDLWLGRHCVWVAWLGLLAATLSPPHGSGFLVCWVQSATGVPCPGCGLTRSLSCGLRGRFLESWHYHPMGLLILALFAFTALQSLCPKTLRDRLAQYLQSRPALFHALYLASVATFLSFGLLRGLLHLAAAWLG